MKSSMSASKLFALGFCLALLAGCVTGSSAKKSTTAADTTKCSDANWVAVRADGTTVCKN